MCKPLYIRNQEPGLGMDITIGNGVEASADTEAEATTRLMQWLEWQHEHTLALDALQQAEREYHRALAGAAFAAPQDGEASDDRSRTSLESVDAARVKLDEVRGRRPSV